jgi:hypothetical protein
MSDGVSVANANASLVSWTADAVYAALAIGPPGSAGTANPSSVTTREAVTWPGSATAGSIAATNEPEWTSWAGTNGEDVTDTAYWSAITAGTFGFSIQLSAPVTMDTGDNLTLTAISASIPTAS